jgi:tRNA pseudouridine13 synthase
LFDAGRNHFDITIREVDASEDDINATLTTVRSVGFINYFGLQRFGKGGVQSHRLGREIFFSNWQQFISMMFVPKEGDRDLMVEAKAAFNCGDYNKALDLLPRSQFRERAVAEWLAKAPNDFSGAFTKIPKDTRLLCAHAYQSYVWNTAVSARIR